MLGLLSILTKLDRLCFYVIDSQCSDKTAFYSSERNELFALMPELYLHILHTILLFVCVLVGAFSHDSNLVLSRIFRNELLTTFSCNLNAVRSASDRGA